MAVTYIPNDAEKKELERLKSVWDTNARNEIIWKARLDLLTAFMTTPAISNAAYGERSQMLDAFKAANTWFDWRNLFGGVIQLASGNVNRTAYINAYADQYNTAINDTLTARQRYLDFKGVLDSKQVDIVAAQSDLLAAETKQNTVKYIFAALGTLIVIYVGYKLTTKFI